MIQDILSWRLNAKRVSLKSFKNSDHWSNDHSKEDVSIALQKRLEQHGFKTRSDFNEERILVSARKGRWNRSGYLFTHIGMVIIFIGGLLDSKMPFSFAEMTGNLKAEYENIPASEVPEISRLPSWNPSFRGSVELPEGQSADLLFVQWRDGYLVQDLPFQIQLKDFRIEHHITGQPKSFESDLVVTDDDLDSPIEATIEVNKPLIYKGYAIYQSSFGDGGSKIDFKQWPLNLGAKSRTFKGTVNKEQALKDITEDYNLEITDFRLFNINPVQQADDKVEQKNFGPSIIFRIRKSTGEALEYDNYMAPVLLDEVPVILTGVRASQAEPFSYLHIPADNLGGPTRFFQLVDYLRDTELLTDLVVQVMGRGTVPQVPLEEKTDDIVKAMSSLVGVFLDGGVDTIVNEIEKTVPKEQQENVRGAYFQVLNSIFNMAYKRVLAAEGVTDYGEKQTKWFQAAVNALGGLSLYGSPVYLQMTSFEHIQASGLQITRSPGKYVVYFGCLLLIVGVFIMFYVHQRRIWLWVETHETGSLILLAGQDLRQRQEFTSEFKEITNSLQRVAKPSKKG